MTFRPGLVHDRAIRGARDKVAPLDFGAIQELACESERSIVTSLTSI